MSNAGASQQGGGAPWLSEVGVAEAARRLLGWTLAVSGDQPMSGRIVETEAYEGEDDPASHAANGPTQRNRVMFGPAGFLYVYRSYGIHWCANVVCGPEGEAGAVLIRAVEPLTGLEAMWGRRPKARKERDLCSGPGKLCAALGVTDVHYGLDLFASSSIVTLHPPDASTKVDPSQILIGSRVGITKAVDRPLRFGVSASIHLSRPFPRAY